MVYKDPAYGGFEIVEPVVLELLKSSPVLRLKKITQHGATVYNREYKKRIITRFEHCFGVYLLLKRFNARLEEQIAGLLHDVSHTVFSHVIDFVFPSDEHDYHEKFYKEIITKSAIPKILKKYRIDPEKVLEEEDFSLLERKLPALCADRLDYFLREIGMFFDYDVGCTLDNLTVIDGHLVFIKKREALRFAKYFLKMNHVFWANPFQEFLYHLLAEALKEAINKGHLVEADLLTTEEEVLHKLRKTKNSLVSRNLKLIESAEEKRLVVSRKDSGIRIKSKIRAVDPLILFGNKIRRLSSIDKKFATFVRNYKDRKSEPYWVRYGGGRPSK